MCLFFINAMFQWQISVLYDIQTGQNYPSRKHFFFAFTDQYTCQTCQEYQQYKIRDENRFDFVSDKNVYSDF